MRDEDVDFYEDDEFIRRKNNCTIFLGYTSNIVSSGLRETIRFLVENKMVWSFYTFFRKKMNQSVLFGMNQSHIYAFVLNRLTV